MLRGLAFERRPLAFAVAAAALVTFLVSLPNLVDPLVRHDDFPALLAIPEGFYAKTLNEGRWLNYWWHLRGIVTPAWVNFALYQLFWAVFAGSLALNALGRRAHPWYVAALAALIVVAPPALLIAPWFNTLIPGLGLVALFAVMGCLLSPRSLRAWLVVFVPLTLMAYTTYPLLLLLVCLTQQGVRHSLRDLVGLMALFVSSFALGMLAIYSLNWVEHGVFGIPLAEWREPRAAHDLASLVGNLPVLQESFGNFLTKVGFNFPAATVFHITLLVLSGIAVVRRRPWVAGYLVAGLGAGLGLVVLQVLTTGVLVPARAMLFIWVAYAVMLVTAGALVFEERGRWARMARNAVVLVAASYAVQVWVHYQAYRAWQADTRALAAQVGPGAGTIWVSGNVEALESAEAAGIQSPNGLRLRLQYLTGRTAFVCELRDDCPEAIRRVAEGAGPERLEVREVAGDVLVSLPKDVALAENASE